MGNDPNNDERFRVFAPVERPGRARLCAWAGCAAEGEFRAPKSRDRLAEYQWFCLEHVRLYNASWNYYKGMTERQMEASIRSDTTWNRPTWKLGDTRGQPTYSEAHPFAHLHDPFGFMGEKVGKAQDRSRGGARSQPSPLSVAQRHAFDVLDLDFPATFDQVKARYKVLVKLHHPDANGGAKEAEERLKQINEAFETLKNGFFA